MCANTWTVERGTTWKEGCSGCFCHPSTQKNPKTFVSTQTKHISNNYQAVTSLLTALLVISRIEEGYVVFKIKAWADWEKNSACWEIWWFLSSADFFLQNLSKSTFVCQTVWVQIRPDGFLAWSESKLFGQTKTGNKVLKVAFRVDDLIMYEVGEWWHSSEVTRTRSVLTADNENVRSQVYKSCKLIL